MLDWPVQIGLQLGVAANASKLTGKVSSVVELTFQPHRFFDIGIGATLPQSFTASLRFWLLHDLFELGLVARGASYAAQVSGTRHLAAGGGLALGKGIATEAGEFGLRLEGLYTYDIDFKARTIPVSVGMFWRS
jgi:hypothetical protein